MSIKEYEKLFKVVTKLNKNLKNKYTKEHYNNNIKLQISLEILPYSENDIKVWVYIYYLENKFELYNSINESHLDTYLNKIEDCSCSRIYYENTDTWESWLKFITRRWKTVRNSFNNLTIPNT